MKSTARTMTRATARREAVNSAISQHCCLRNNQWLPGSVNDCYYMWAPAWSGSTVRVNFSLCGCSWPQCPHK